ncbi:hypothetical protein [Flectobacillus roseus]|uniref:hypothetical protein n=1 Tax=Flectobacillus roseus TaxID=502259 RepID=UPI0024B82904|nr:hypothetical protein [Flectobacillus roseus]MDI9872555.1 hypothetical protein [Flectobacillus roseus]
MSRLAEIQKAYNEKSRPDKGLILKNIADKIGKTVRSVQNRLSGYIAITEKEEYYFLKELKLL